MKDRLVSPSGLLWGVSARLHDLTEVSGMCVHKTCGGTRWSARGYEGSRKD
jgi:hypothetical protein